MAHSLIQIQEGTLVAEKIPVTLMQQYLHKYQHLFIDNYYASMSLVQYLIENGTYVTGTIRDNRKTFLHSLGKSVWTEEGCILQLCWYCWGKIQRKQWQFQGQPKIICILSTGHSAAMRNTNKKNRDENITKSPQASFIQL